MTEQPLPRLAVVLLTYDRLEYARRTLSAVMENADYQRLMHLVIADDGSPEGYVEELVGLAKQRAWASIRTTNANRGGYGRSYNLASQVTHNVADVVLPLEDDWELTRYLDLTPLVRIISEPASPVECLRLGYVGFTQELRGIFEHIAGQTVLRLDPFSPEPHVFAGHPRLETVEWQRRVGPWAEGLAAGATEFEVARRLEARLGVGWPVDHVLARGDLFAHIGTIHARSD